jgi:photosystem II stability/assembly factor-like uncharacterized protein
MSIHVFIAIWFFTTSAFSQIYFWEPTNGTFVGTKVNATAFVSSNIVIVATNNGLFRSTNAGETWVRSNNEMADSVILSLLFDAHVGLLAGTRTGAYRSTDDGLTWLAFPSFPQKRVHSLVSDSNGFIFAATDSGIYRSTDDGNHWIQTNVGLTSIRITSLAVGQDDFLFSGTFGEGVFYSTDHGETWIHTSLTTPWVYGIVISTKASVFVWESTSIYRSTNNGETWISSGLMSVSSLATNPSGAIFVGTQYCEASPLCGSIQPGGLYRSEDDGITWDYIGFMYSNITVLNSNMENRMFVQSKSGALYRSADNGSSWTQNSLLIDLINVLLIKPDRTLFAGGRTGCFRSTDRGNTWINTSPGAIPYEVLSLGFKSPNYIFAGTVGWRVYCSTDDGVSWTELSLGLQPSQEVKTFTSDSSGYVFAGTFQGGIYRSSDNGDNWIQVNNGLGNLTVRCIVTSSFDDVIAGTDAGIYSSSNHGDSWSRIGDSVIGFVQTIQTFPPNIILIGTYLNGIYRSTNNGATWVQINSGLTNLNVRSIICISSKTFFAGTAGGVFLSADSGNSWIPTNAGLTNTGINSLAYEPGGTIYVGTWGDGVFRSTQIVSNVREFSASLPISYMLKQNYPNPFNPSTELSFVIGYLPARRNHAERDAGGSFVTLKVYDILGREIATLVNERKQAGEYKVTWNAEGVPSGVYFYRIVAGEFIETKKMVVVK